MRVSLLTLFATIAIAGPAAAADKNEAFFAALYAGDQAKVADLLEKDPSLASARGEDGTSAVFAAATNRKDKEGFLCTEKNPILDLIVARKPALDVIDAALVGDTARLTALLVQDPKLLGHQKPVGWTPLHAATFAGKLEAVKMLLARGTPVDVRAKNKFKNAPIQTAMLCHEGEVVAYLLAQGADPNIRQHEGFHVMHEAAILGRTDLVQLLLDHGADVNPRSDDGETPLGTAVRTGKTAMADYLRARGGKE